MKTNLLNTGILFLTMTVGAISARAQADGGGDGTAAPAADQSVLERLRAARAAADGGAAPTPDAGAFTAPAPGVTVAPDASMVAAAATNATPDVTAPVAANAPSEPSRRGSPTPSLAAFDLIWQRNVFDPNRQPYQAGRAFAVNVPVARPKRVETLRFCGTVEKIGKGYDALFTGDGAPESGVLDVGDAVNGLKIAAITNNAVTLVDPNNTNNAQFVVMTENGPNAITRGDGGPWRTMYVSATYSQPYRAAVLDDTQNNLYTGTLQTDAFGGDPNAAFGGNNFGNQGNFGGGGGGRQRGRGGRGGGGAGGGGGGFGGGAGGGGFGGGGGGFGGFGGQQDTTAAPAAPVDPAVLARLQARRAAGN